MIIQILKDRDGKPEFLVIPITKELGADSVRSNKKLIEAVEDAMDDLYADLAGSEPEVEFELGDYISNPVKVLRIHAGLTQKELAGLLACSQANVSQIENSEKVSEEIVSRVKAAVSNL